MCEFPSSFLIASIWRLLISAGRHVGIAFARLVFGAGLSEPLLPNSQDSAINPTAVMPLAIAKPFLKTNLSYLTCAKL